VIFGIDTQILIYAEAVPPKNGNRCKEFAELQERAKLLIYKAADDGDTIVLPAVVISELLVPVPSSQRGAVVQVLEKTFQCPPLDIPAATIAADLWSKFRSLPEGQTVNISRNVLRADALIVASARAANATHFYSHDAQCRKLAELAGMKALDLPVATEMNDHFLVSDIRTNTVPERRAPKTQGSKARKKSAKSAKAKKEHQ
jgi:predicted nucleic acid-binding protein